MKTKNIFDDYNYTQLHTIIHGDSETIVIYFGYQISITILARQTDSGPNLFSHRLTNLEFCPYTAWAQN